MAGLQPRRRRRSHGLVVNAESTAVSRSSWWAAVGTTVPAPAGSEAVRHEQCPGRRVLVEGAAVEPVPQRQLDAGHPGRGRVAVPAERHRRVRRHWPDDFDRRRERHRRQLEQRLGVGRLGLDSSSPPATRRRSTEPPRHHLGSLATHGDGILVRPTRTWVATPGCCRSTCLRTPGSRGWRFAGG